MANIIKFRLSQASATEIFTKKGGLPSHFITGNVELSQQQREIIAKTKVFESSLHLNDSILDFSEEISRFENPYKGTQVFTFEAESEDFDKEVERMCELLIAFFKREKLLLTKAENRAKYLHTEAAEEIAWINPKFCDEETYEYIQSVIEKNSLQK